MRNKEFNIINNLIYKNKLKFIREAKKSLKGEPDSQHFVDIIDANLLDKKNLLNLLDKFNSISLLEIRELVKNFIFLGEVDFVLENIDKFSGIKHVDVFYFLIKNKDYKNIALHRELPIFEFFEDNDLILNSIKMCQVDNRLEVLGDILYLSRSTVLEISENYDFDNLSGFINKLRVFSETDEEKYENDMKFFDLLMEGNLNFNFNKLQFYSKKQAAIRLINNDYANIVIQSLLTGQFRDCNVDYILCILLYLINFNKSDLVIIYLNSLAELFPKLKNKEFNSRIVSEIIKTGNGGLILNNMNVFEGLNKDIVIAEMLKYGYGINYHPTKHSYEIDLNSIKKILKKNKLESLESYLLVDGDLEYKFLSNLSEKIRLLPKYYKDIKLFSFKEKSSLWEVELAQIHKIQGAVFSMFLLNSILIDLNEIIDRGEMEVVLDLCGLDMPCLERVDWVTADISNPESILDFTKEFIKKLADSNNFKFILNNIETFSGYLEDIINFIAYSHSNLISFDNIRKLEKINIYKINIHKEIAEKLFYYDNLQALALNLPELRNNCANLLSESLKEEMKDLRDYIEIEIKEGMEHYDNREDWDYDEYRDDVEVNRDEYEDFDYDENQDIVEVNECGHKDQYYYLG